MEALRVGLLTVYYTTLAILAVYGGHRLWLLFLLSRRRGRPAPSAQGADSALPVVTVQIPIYNEQNVAPRLIEAVSRFEYPRERLEIQVLDDSTDATTAVVAAAVARLRAL